MFKRLLKKNLTLDKKTEQQIRQCKSCLYMDIPHEDAHCYMFKTMVVGCGQYTKEESNV